jgi:hypothetical protein
MQCQLAVPFVVSVKTEKGRYNSPFCAPAVFYEKPTQNCVLEFWKFLPGSEQIRWNNFSGSADAFTQFKKNRAADNEEGDS